MEFERQAQKAPMTSNRQVKNYSSVKKIYLNFYAGFKYKYKNAS